jgi:hypothetical protein
LLQDRCNKAATRKEEPWNANQGRRPVVRALIALLLLSRYFALSRAGMPLGWMLYLGLPIIAAGVLFALRLTNLGAGWGTKIDHVQHTTGAPPHRPLSLSQSAVPVSERLEELQAMHANGAISDTEYRARRLQIISET